MRYGCEADAVTSGFLRVVHRRVRGLEQAVEVVGVSREHRYTDGRRATTDGDLGTSFVGGGDSQRGDGGPDPFCREFGGRGIGVGKQQQELLAAEPTDEVGGPGDAGQRIRHRGERVVPQDVRTCR